MRRRQTKIIATIGPATAGPDRIRALLQAGADVLRLNFSYGRAEDHAATLATIRRIEQEIGRPVGVIADLQGVKLRIGTFRGGGIALERGQRLRLDLDPAPGDATRVSLPHPEVIDALEPGGEIVLDDGKVRLRVLEQNADHLVAEVVAGARLSDHKGLHVPHVTLPVSALTEKDRRDLRVAVDAGFDWIALSFVQSPQDVVEARRLIGAKAGIIVKIEREAALDHLAELIELADAVMVARGDLGVEMPPERVPSLQKRIVHEARAGRKPVAITTQMLESMVDSPMPTRAEASDVATAVYDGADALALSAETAAGGYPVEAVAMVDRIARAVEEDPLYRTFIDADAPPVQESTPEAIVASAHRTAKTIGAQCLAIYSTAGATCRRAAKERPAMPILGLSASLPTARRLALSYGVHPVHVPEFRNVPDMVQMASRVAVEHGFAVNGDQMVMTAGVPLGAAGMTNIMRVAWVDDGNGG
jgi:pyruvate kinase